METPKEKLTEYIFGLAELIGFDPLTFVALLITPYVVIILKRYVEGKEMTLTDKIYNVGCLITAFVIYLYLIIKYLF
jgi:hypothetical protein